MKGEKLHRIRPKQTKFARQLRREATIPERLLWGRLRGRRGPGNFRRQFPIGEYIVDFCCPAAKLVVELDGHSHNASAEYDVERERRLKEMGFEVIRFTNDDVLRDLDGIVFANQNALGSISNAKVSTLTPSPLPSRERGTKSVDA